MITFTDKNLVKNFSDLMHQYMSEVMGRKNLTFNTGLTLAEKELLFNKAALSEIERISGQKMEGTFAPEVMAQNPMLRFAAFGVVGELIDTITPEVLNNSIGIYTDTRFGQFGQSFRFDIASNDLFYVSKVGRNKKNFEAQRQFSGTQYIVPENHAITVQFNLFRALCGEDSIAQFVMKAILSLEASITKEMSALLDTATGALPTTPTGGSLKVTAAGGVVDKTEAMRLAQAVTAFNGGAEAMFVGTKVALSHLIPAAAEGFRYTESGIAYFPNVWGVKTLEMPQVADWQNKYKLSLNDDRIYVISPGAQKLFKLCYEGATTTDNTDAHDSANHTGFTTLNKSYGVGVCTNAIAGVITLA